MLSSDPQKRITSEELHARSSQLGSNTASGESHGIQVPSLTTPVSYCHRSGSRFCDASPLPLDEEPDHLDKTLEFLQQAPSLMYPQYWRKPGAC